MCIRDRTQRLACRVGLVGLVCTLIACTNPNPIKLTTSDALSLAGSRIATVQRSNPPFRVKSLTEGALSLVPNVGPIVGRAASVRAGRKLVNAKGLSDPASHIGSTLALDLCIQYGASPPSMIAIRPTTGGEKAGTWLNERFNNRLTIALSRESKNDLIKHRAGADYLLDVRTTDWSVGFYRTNWLRYKLHYTSELRLIDTRTDRLIARGKYTYATRKSKASPRYDALVADNAAILKEEQQRAVDASVAHFRTNVLCLSNGSDSKPVHTTP